MATRKRSEAEIQAEINEVQDEIDEIDNELDVEEAEEKPKKAKKTKKGELKVVEQEVEETEKKSLKEKAKEFGEKHPKGCKIAKRVATGLTVVAAAVLGYKAGQDSMIEDLDLEEIEISDEE